MGRKDLFQENQTTIKKNKQKTIKPEKRKTRKTGTHLSGNTEKNQKIKATFQIPENLFIQIKIKAAKERKKISDLVTEVLAEHF